jgi:DNA polymerase I-like protein with 3'-5' exonuclease and polymerase domains
MMDVVVLDFESYYSQTYSLSKMTTEQYVRDAQFETIGLSVKVNDGKTVWFSGNDEDTQEFLNTFDWANSIAIAHNAIFDMAILNWRYGIRPKRIVDTLSMARALVGANTSVSLKSLAEYFGIGEKGTEVVQALGKRRADFTPEELRRYGHYCVNDVELTRTLFDALVDMGFPTDEFKLVDLTTRMFTEPVLELDATLLADHLRTVQATKEELLSKVLVDKSQLMSNPQFAELLKARGVEPPMKVSPTTGKETFAFSKSDEAFKELLEHEDFLVQALVAARLGVKSTLEETRTERFIGLSGRGNFPVPLRYYGAHTGRWSGEDKINLQNLPRGSSLKKAILAPEGYVFIDSDSSQIEARTLAWLAGQDDLVAAFDAGEDVYKIMATKIYGVALEDVTGEQRRVAKSAVLGCGYGLGWRKFKLYVKQQTGVSITDDDAENIVRTYRETYPMIPLFWRKVDRALEAVADNERMRLGCDDLLLVDGNNGIVLPNGLRLKYPNMRRRQDEESGKVGLVYDTKKGRSTIPKFIWGGAGTENICQALARIVIGEQMVQVAKRYRVVMTVHDSIGCIAPEGEAQEALDFVQECMRIRPTWAPELPLDCEAGYGASYGDC